MIARPTTAGEIRGALLEEYEVDRERCEQDLERFLSELAEQGLIQVRDGPAQETAATPEG